MPITSSKKTIAIIGAGVSGLQAARTILTHPSAAAYNIIIFEARNRIGGRVDTKRKWEVPLDYGANFIHGTEGNPLAKIAKKVGSTFVEWTTFGNFFDKAGNALSERDAAFVYEKVFTYSGMASQYSREETIDKDVSVKDFCIEKLESDKEIKGDRIKGFIVSGLEMLQGIAACDIDKLSLKYFWMEDDLPGNRPFIDSTYDPILQYIANPSLEKDAIRLNTKITSLNLRPADDKPIMLMTDASETFPVDSVICTIPLGCLHRNDLNFTPPLPDTVQTAISNLGFGVLEKLYIRFPEIWWLHEVRGEEYALEFTTFPTELIESPVPPKGSFVLVSLAKTHYPAPIFQVFVSTTLAKYFVRLPRATLRTMFQEYIIPHLPYYDPANPACQISEVDSSEWSQDPLAGFGSYTHIPVGSDSGDGNMAVLAGRILEAEDGRGGVWFAGEHTADTEVIDGVKYTTMATVTGAYKSGTRAGNHVLQYYEGS